MLIMPNIKFFLQRKEDLKVADFTYKNIMQTTTSFDIVDFNTCMTSLDRDRMKYIYDEIDKFKELETAFLLESNKLQKKAIEELQNKEDGSVE